MSGWWGWFEVGERIAPGEQCTTERMRSRPNRSFTELCSARKWRIRREQFQSLPTVFALVSLVGVCRRSWRWISGAMVVGTET